MKRYLSLLLLWPLLLQAQPWLDVKRKVPQSYLIYDDFSIPLSAGSVSGSNPTKLGRYSLGGPRILNDTSNEVAIANATGFIVVGDSKSANTFGPSTVWKSLIGTANNPYYELWPPLALSGQTTTWVSNNVVSYIAGATIAPSVILWNLSINDYATAVVTFTNNYNYIIDKLHTKWPTAHHYFAFFWKSNSVPSQEATDTQCAALNGLITNSINYNSNLFGNYFHTFHDESSWLKGSWDGSKYVGTADGIHYNSIGNWLASSNINPILPTNTSLTSGAFFRGDTDSYLGYAGQAYTNGLCLISDYRLSYLGGGGYGYGGPGFFDAATNQLYGFYHYNFSPIGIYAKEGSSEFLIHNTNTMFTNYTSYFVLKPKGCYFFLKGDLFQYPTLLYESVYSNTSTVFPGFYTVRTNTTARLSAIRIPNTLITTIAPSVSDSFSGALGELGTTDGLGHQEQNGGAGLTWTGSSWSTHTNNLIQNPGLEIYKGVQDDATTDTIDGWSQTIGTGGLIEATATSHSGNAVKITRGTTSTQFNVTVIGVIPGEAYTLAFWCRGDGVNSVYYYLMNLADSSYIKSNSSAGVVGTNFQQIIYTFTAPASLINLRINFQMNVNSSYGYVDDVELFRTGSNCAINTPVTGNDLIINGDMSSDAGWNLGAGWEIAGGVATATAASSKAITQSVVSSNKWYKSSFTISSYTAGSVYSLLGTAVGPLAYAAIGNYTFTGRSDDVTGGLKTSSTATTLSVDNVTIQELNITNLFASVQSSTPNVIASAAWARSVTGSQFGLVANLDVSTYTNYVLAYYNGTNKITLEYCLNGVYTTVGTSSTLTYSPYGRIVLISTPSESFARVLYDNNSTVVTAVSGGIPSGLSSYLNVGVFSTSTNNIITNFVCRPRGTEGQYSILNNH